MKIQTIVICIAVLAMCSIVTQAKRNKTSPSEGEDRRSRDKDDITPKEDQKKRKEVEKVINKLSPVCRDNIKAQRTDNQSLVEACYRLESSQSSMGQFNCTTEDVQRLHKAVCFFGKRYIGSGSVSETTTTRS